MRASTLTWVLITAMGIALACGPQQPPRSPKVDEITALWTQIRDWRREAGLPVEPRHEDVIQIRPIPYRDIGRVCPDNHPVPATCSDVCSLADAICDNAEQICILADELGKDDEWAQDKCASAKASCREAKKKCCKCSEDNTRATLRW